MMEHISEGCSTVQQRIFDQCNQLSESGKRIALYGAGSHTLYLLLRTKLVHGNIVGIIDRKKELGELCFGVPVYHPDQLCELDADVVLVSVPRAETDIADFLKEVLPVHTQILTLYDTDDERQTAVEHIKDSLQGLGVTLAGRQHVKLSDKDRYGAYYGITSVLDKLGYPGSVKSRVPCDSDGLPLPWYTYPAIFYLKQFALKSCSVFEWGCGNSSLFYAARCKSVRSIDISSEWVDTVTQTAPDNLEVHHRPVDVFPGSIRSFHDAYDIIVIDAERRLDCARECIPYLKPEGLIIVDNSDNAPGTCSFLRDQGLLQVDFTGFGPVCSYRWTTSLFFSGNCRPLQQARSMGEPVYGLDRNLDFYEDEAAMTAEIHSGPVQPAPPLYAGLVSYAQEGEDILLDKILRRLLAGRKGFYVDVGANDPTKHSLTHRFYKQGWRGINIEPRPESKALFDQIRPRDINVETGVSDLSGELTYHMFEVSVYNTFDTELAKEFSRSTKSLGSRLLSVQRLDVLLDEYVPEGQTIDLLSVDVEGFELNVLRSSNWEKYRPLVVALEVLEYDLGQGPEQAAPVQFMIEQNYRFLAKTENTLIFADVSRYSLFSSAK